MQQRDRFPIDVVTGACLVTYSADTRGEPIVDLDLDVETLPMHGRICISAEGVRLLMNCLGWVMPTEDLTAVNDRLLLANRTLSGENRELRHALAKIIDVARLVNLVRVAELADEFPDLEPA